MFFSMFPKIQVNVNGKTIEFKDIFRRISVNKFSNNYSFLETITIPDGYTIEQISDKFYKRPDYHWTIMIVNDMVNLRQEWPMSSSDVIAYARNKYGYEGLYNRQHFRTTDEDQLTVDSNYSGAKEEISNLQYEEELNDSKREIKIISSKFISKFVSEFANTVGS